MLRPVFQQSPQGCPRNSANVCLVEHRLFPTSEGGMLAASFLHSSFLQAMNAVMLWPVHIQKLKTVRHPVHQMMNVHTHNSTRPKSLTSISKAVPLVAPSSSASVPTATSSSSSSPAPPAVRHSKRFRVQLALLPP